MNSQLFHDMILEPDQEQLLMTIVEAARNIPREERRKFVVARSNAGDFLLHPGIPDSEKQIYYGDVETLGRAGLLAIGFGAKGSPNFDVTPLGFRYYESIRKKIGKPVERIEATVHDYLDSQGFCQRYPQAFARWRSAEEILWSADTEEQLTTIGHLCREAVQLFATALVERFELSSVTSDVTRTVARLRAVLDARAARLPGTVKPFLEALLAYWGTVNDLIQRQEHGAQKEGKPLLWEDGRRVVFQTAIVMFEIDKAL